MSDESESVRLPREVWMDFATSAARGGFVSLPMLAMLASSGLSAGSDVTTLTIYIVGGFLVAGALDSVCASLSTGYRHLGLAPVAATVVFGSAVALSVTREFGVCGTALLCSWVLGLRALRPLKLTEVSTADALDVVRVRRFQRAHTAAFVGLAVAHNAVPFAVLMVYGGGPVPGEFAVAARWYFIVVTAILCVWCWLRFLRPFVELCLEPFARLLYRVRAKGELNGFPALGPCLVIANHAFWFDPCILGLILPRPITPIMTASFYRVWFLRPLLQYVFRVIMVPETAMKRDTPEVDGAIAALDRGEVVVIFPEGYLRRKEEVPLRRFGQGVWRILAARPDTPVVPCWIEGGWGSKFSFKDGPPGAKGKKMDLRRRIDVGVRLAVEVPTELHGSGMGTRIRLMNLVGAARTQIGLERLPFFDQPPVSDSTVPEEPA